MDEGGAKEDYSLSFELEDSDESLQLSSEDVSQPSPDSDAAKEPRPPVRTTTTTTTTTTSKKPPRPPSAASGDGSISLSRTIRSPLAMAHLLNQDRVTDDSDAHASPSPHTLKPPTFKQVASTVQTMQSTAKKFKSSGEIREVAYKEWLAKKEAKDMHERAKCAASKESAEDRAKQQQKEVQ